MTVEEAVQIIKDDVEKCLTYHPKRAEAMMTICIAIGKGEYVLVKRAKNEQN